MSGQQTWALEGWAAGFGFLAAIVVILTSVVTVALIFWGLRAVRRLDRLSRNRPDDAVTQLTRAEDDRMPLRRP